MIVGRAFTARLLFDTSIPEVDGWRDVKPRRTRVTHQETRSSQWQLTY
jgi:hypothetical protein